MYTLKVYQNILQLSPNTQTCSENTKPQHILQATTDWIYFCIYAPPHLHLSIPML